MIWHNNRADEVIKELSADRTSGLSSGEVFKRLEIYGKNEIHDSEKVGFGALLLKQVTNYFNLALFIFAITYFVIALLNKEINLAEPLLIIIFLALHTLASAGISYRNAAKNRGLRTSHSGMSTVIRDGGEQLIDSANIVPGDILVLNAGDYIPADGRIIDSYVLMCDEFAHTGQNVPIEKFHETVLDSITPLSERNNMVLAGSFVKSGKALAVVTETGENTALGRTGLIRREIEKKDSPLEAKLKAAGKIYLAVTVVSAVLIFLLGVLVHIRSYETGFENTVLSHLLLGLSITASNIPEGLAAILTMAVAFSVQRLEGRNLTFIDLSAIEAIGGASVICTDKTGILTDENMTLVKISSGTAMCDLGEEKPAEPHIMLLNLALICSNMNDSSHAERHSNALELAIERASMKITGVSKNDIDGIYPTIAELPFDSDRRLMTTVTIINSKPYSVTKGAPEVILERCDLADKEPVLKLIDDLAEDGLKVLAVALKPLCAIPANPTTEELENGLTFVGLMAFDNPPDPVAVREVAECRRKNIRVVMLTGDHPKTAEAIALRFGIIRDSSEVLSHEALSAMSDEELLQNINKHSVFARASAEDKLRVVKALKQNGDEVLLTCDTVSDLPAMAEADYGCALGQTASDSIKAAAGFIVDDNKFSTLVLALKESNRIFDSVLRSLKFLISSSAASITAIIFGLIIFGNSPFTATTLLLINLIIMLFPKLAFSSETKSSTLSFRRHENRELLNLRSIIGMAVPSLIIAILTLVAYGICLGAGQGAAAAAAFAVMAICEAVHAFSQSHTYSVLQKGVTQNRAMPIACVISIFLSLLVLLTPVRNLLSFAPLTGGGWLMLILSGVITFATGEAIKFASKKELF